MFGGRHGGWDSQIQSVPSIAGEEREEDNIKQLIISRSSEAKTTGPKILWGTVLVLSQVTVSHIPSPSVCVHTHVRACACQDTWAGQRYNFQELLPRGTQG